MKLSVLLLSLVGSFVLAAPAVAGKKDKEKEKEEAPAPPPPPEEGKKKKKAEEKKADPAPAPAEDAEKKKKKKQAEEKKPEEKKPEEKKPEDKKPEEKKPEASKDKPPPKEEPKGIPGAGFCSAIQLDGKTLIDSFAVPSDSKGVHNYVGCSAKLEEKIRPVLCPKGKKGNVDFLYKIGANNPGKSSILCKG